jgi:hypothetical protein
MNLLTTLRRLAGQQLDLIDRRGDDDDRRTRIRLSDHRRLADVCEVLTDPCEQVRHIVGGGLGDQFLPFCVAYRRVFVTHALIFRGKVPPHARRFRGRINGSAIGEGVLEDLDFRFRYGAARHDDPP